MWEKLLKHTGNFVRDIVDKGDISWGRIFGMKIRKNVKFFATYDLWCGVVIG